MKKIREIEAVVCIVHDKDDFLLLKKQGTWVGWQFVQGAQDKKETKENAVLREVMEETSLKGTIEKKLRFRRDYWYVEKGEKIHKHLTFFIISAKKTDKVRLCEEHSDYGWYKKDEVTKLLKYNKDIFKKILEGYFQ